MQIFLGLKVREGLAIDFQIWDFFIYMKQKELFFQYQGFSACVDADYDKRKA